MRALIIGLLGFIFSFSAFGQIHHLVFQVNGTLVQGVPSRNTDSVKKGKLLKVNHKGRTRYFALYQKMEKLLFALQSQNNVVLHFYDDDKELAKALLAEIPLAGSLKVDVILSDQVSKLFGPEDLAGNQLDLNAISSDKNVWFVSSRVKDASLVSPENFVPAGKEVFYFESYQEASTEEARIRQAGNAALADTYFAVQDVWERSMKKASLLFAKLMPGIYDGNLGQYLEQAKKKNPHDLLVLGEKAAVFDFLRFRMELTAEGERFFGCQKIENLEGETVATYSPLQCSSIMNIEVSYQSLAPGGFTCEISGKGANTLSGISLTSCLSLRQYHPRQNLAASSCAAFDRRGRMLDLVSNEECDGKEIFVPVPGKDRVFAFGQRSPEFTGLSEAEIAAALVDVPEESDPYKLWFPYERDESVGFEWRDCRVQSENGHPIREENGTLREECEGDTFYSWGPQIKLDNLKEWMGSGNWKDEFRALFMARTPIGSFGYGPVALRIKLRSDLTWSRSRSAHGSCNIDLGTKAKVAFYRTMSLLGGKLLDIIICSPKAIHSWSHSTKEHYDEIIKDYWWTVKRKRAEDLYEVYINNISSLFTGSSVDSKDFRVSTLERYIGGHLKRIKENKGEIFVNPEFRDDFVREEHFSTDYPIYFNER